MSRKIIGVTVGTPISPARLDRELKPVKTVNGVSPDVDGNVEIPVGEKIIDLSDEFLLGYIEMEALNNDDLLLECLQSKSFQFTAGDLGLDMAYLNVEKLPTVVVTGYNDGATIDKQIKVVSADVGAETPADSYIPTVVLTADLSSDNYLRISQQFISQEDGDGYYTMENFTPINDATFSLVPKAQKTSDGTQFANSLKGSASGEVVALKDVSPLEHGLGVRVSSKNLLDFKNITQAYSPPVGVTYEKTDNSIKIDNDGSSYSGSVTFNMPMTADMIGRDLTLSYKYESVGIRSIQVAIFYLKNNVQVVAGNAVNGVGTFKAPDDVDKIQIRFICYLQSEGVAGSITYSDVLLKKGTTATTYTPFVPDVGAVKVKAQGANILDITEMLNDQLVNNGDGTYTFTRGANSRFSAYCDINIPAETYIKITNEIVDYNSDMFGFQFFMADGTSSATVPFFPEKRGSSQYFRTNVTRIRIFADSTIPVGSYVRFKNLQIKYGTTATEYEPYIEHVEYAVNADGTVEGVKSIYPATTLTTDTVGALIEVDYNKDANKVVATLEERISALEALVVSQ